MSNTSITGCLYQRPSAGTLLDIANCQNASTTPFCWPQNRTRICVPGGTFPIVWSPGYFKPDSQLMIEYAKGSRTYPLRNQTAANLTVNADLSMFWANADPITGSSSERVMTIWMRETDTTGNQQKHVGPTVTLVNTFAPATTSATSKSNDDSSGFLEMSKGTMVGVILSIIVGITLLITLCCCCGWCACCGGKPRRKPKFDRNKHATILESGAMLMEQRNAQSEPARMEEARRTLDPRAEANAGGQGERDHLDPPPKYTP